jgi:hypothetical protein
MPGRAVFRWLSSGGVFAVVLWIAAFAVFLANFPTS